MALPEFLQPALDWIETRGLVTTELAGLGLVLAGLIIFLALVFFLRKLLDRISTMRSAISAGARSRKQQIGYQVLIARPEGRSGRSAFNFLSSAADNYLSSFSFDAPLQIARTAQIGGGRTMKAERAARLRLKRADADLIVWGERVGKGHDGLVVYTLSRAGGKLPDEAVLDHFSLPARSKDRDDRVKKIAAYLLAKRLQPSLGHPSDFRAERLEPIAEELEDLLGATQELSSQIRYELEHDFSKAALHVGTKEDGEAWLDKVVEMRGAALERLGDAPQPGVWSDAKLDLGRALILKAERKFDPAMIAEGSKHLRDAVEILKSDPSIRRAEEAMETIDTARRLSANRDRFSINFGS